MAQMVSAMVTDSNLKHTRMYPELTKSATIAAVYHSMSYVFFKCFIYNYCKKRISVHLLNMGDIIIVALH